MENEVTGFGVVPTLHCLEPLQEALQSAMPRSLIIVDDETSAETQSFAKGPRRVASICRMFVPTLERVVFKGWLSGVAHRETKVDSVSTT